MYLISSTHTSNEEIYLFSRFLAEYFHLSAFYCIFIFTNIFEKYNHTFEFKESFSMFQTSSSAIVSVTSPFLQDNPCIYITINTMILCRLNVSYE